MPKQVQTEADAARERVARSREIRKELGLKEARVSVWVDAKHVQTARDLMKDACSHLRVYLEDDDGQ